MRRFPSLLLVSLLLSSLLPSALADSGGGVECGRLDRIGLAIIRDGYSLRMAWVVGDKPLRGLEFINGQFYRTLRIAVDSDRIAGAPAGGIGQSDYVLNANEANPPGWRLRVKDSGFGFRVVDIQIPYWSMLATFPLWSQALRAWGPSDEPAEKWQPPKRQPGPFPLLPANSPVPFPLISALPSPAITAR